MTKDILLPGAMLPEGDRPRIAATKPWPKDLYLQGGENGLVVVRGEGSYRTAFVECFPKDDTVGFIRGEGTTVLEAEEDCWNNYQKAISCKHEWEARDYQNGGGICKHCGQFGAKVFTPEDLGLYCRQCDTPTYWHHDKEGWLCKECCPPLPFDNLFP